MLCPITKVTFFFLIYENWLKNNVINIKFGAKSMILFISNPIYFLKNLVLCLIQLFDFESLLDFYIILEIINSHTNFFY